MLKTEGSILLLSTFNFTYNWKCQMIESLLVCLFREELVSKEGRGEGMKGL